jgi:hypothetical protein
MSLFSKAPEPNRSIMKKIIHRFSTSNWRQLLKISKIMDSCQNNSCIEQPSTPLLRCDGCTKRLIHHSCFESCLKQRSSYNDDFIFCSVPCVDAGPLILLPELKNAGKLNKLQLKVYLRSKELRVVDDNGKDIAISDLIDTLVVFRNTLIDGKEEYCRIKNHKMPNCYFRLLNAFFMMILLNCFNKQALQRLAHNGAVGNPVDL